MITFDGVVHRRGPNPCVDVPAWVGERLASYAHAGRIRISGRIAGAGFSATLVPAKSGGHILYLPGGLRALTGVQVGDSVSVEMRPLERGEVWLPDDLAAALDDVAGGRDTFANLSASHRRELIRYLEDARTPQARSRRLEQIVDHVLGREVRPPGLRRQRTLWTCPTCGRGFVTRNIYHSCSEHTLAEPFAGKPAHVRELFDSVRQVLEGFGPVTLVPYRDRVAFMVRVRFAGVTPRQRWVDVDFWLTRRVESPRLHKVETLSPYTHVHTVRLAAADDVDDELTGWLREAYAVGCQEHLRPAPG